MVTKSKTGQVVLNIVFIILAVWAVAPFLLLISSSLSSEAALAKYGYGFWPREFSLNAYTYLFKSSMKIAKGYGITLIVTLVGTTLSVLITTLFAYPLSRKELPFRYGFSFFVFFTMLFNGGLVPSYMMWTQTFHIKNTIWALIMPSLLLNAFYLQHSGRPHRGSQNRRSRRVQDPGKSGYPSFQTHDGNHLPDGRLRLLE